METDIVHWDYFGMMEKKMETTIDMDPIGKLRSLLLFRPQDSPWHPLQCSVEYCGALLDPTIDLKHVSYDQVWNAWSFPGSLLRSGTVCSMAAPS